MNSFYKLWCLTLLLVAVLACSFGGDVGETPAEPTMPPPVGGPDQPAELESATVARVIDGDTVELVDGRRVRYIGINTPERNQPYYQDASEANRRLVENKPVRLEFDQDTFDQYGRTLAYIWADGVLVNREIVRLGFANGFTVPPNVRYEAQIRTAEQEARDAGRGLWAGAGVALKIVHIEANAPGNDQENPNGEWVEVVNEGGEPVDMSGFTMKDEASHIYTFREYRLAPGQSFQLFSGEGRDSNAELYWGLVGDSVWNNDSDTAFLRDGQGALVDMYAY
jgi:micrococcal nuclease